MKLFVLDNGVLDLDLMWLVLNPTPATTENKNPDNKWVRVPTYTVLIEHPQLGYVLFDGTCHPEWDSRWPEALRSIFPYTATENQHLPAQLAEVNLTVDDIDLVVISHLHLDHCGCLDLFRGTKAARRGIVVHDKELSHSLKVTHVGPENHKGAYVAGEFDLPNLNYDLMIGSHLGGICKCCGSDSVITRRPSPRFLRPFLRF